MKDLNTTSLNKISRDISGPPGRKSIRDLSTGALYLTGPIQDLLISLDLLGPFTGAPYKISSQDLYQARPLWNVSALYKISSQNLYEKSLHKSSLQDLVGLFTGALYKISSQDLYERSLYKSFLKRSLHKTFMRVSTRSLRKTSMRDTRSLHKTPMRDLYTRALYKVFSQAPNETSLCKISWYPWTS